MHHAPRTSRPVATLALAAGLAALSSLIAPAGAAPVPASPRAQDAEASPSTSQAAAAAPAAPQAAPPAAAVPSAEELAPKYDQYMRALVDATGFSGAVLVAREGRTIYRGAWGVANVEGRAGMTPDMRFRIGSITKPFTAMAVMLLAERGALAVTDSICRFVDPCPAAWQPVTLHHLLTHTSGIPSYTALPDYEKTMGRPAAPVETIGRVRDLPLEFAPGAQFKYNNTGYVLLGLAIEKASGQSYAAFLRAAILDPLGMKDTGYETPQAGLVTGFRMARPGDAASAVPAEPIDPSVPFAAGALYSTVNDLLKLDRAIAGRKLLKAATWEQMLTPVQGNYGYGFTVQRPSPQRTIVNHDGGINGFSSSFTRVSDQDLAVIVLRNQSEPLTFTRDLIGIALGRPYQLPKKRVVAAVDPAIYDAYVGDYELQPGFVLTVSRDGARLLTQATGQPQVEVFPESETTFFLKVVEAQITFQKDAGGKVTGLVLRQNGREMPARKVR